MGWDQSTRFGRVWARASLFKTVEAGVPRLAGSIPVRLRYQRRCVSGSSFRHRASPKTVMAKSTTSRAGWWIAVQNRSRWKLDIISEVFLADGPGGGVHRVRAVRDARSHHRERASRPPNDLLCCCQPAARRRCRSCRV
jgi:hypothetical protein